MTKSISYYNLNAESFYNRTINVDLTETYEKFLHQLPPHARILDAGCGTGRDARRFKSYGYDVLSFDASEEMVKLSSGLLGHPTLLMEFKEMAFQNEFNGVWANASLLHIPYDEQRVIVQKIHESLKPGGIFFATYKYGHEMRVVEERTFYDMNEEKIAHYLEDLFEVIACWQTPDTRSQIAPRWLNVLARAI